mgnify:FL=1|tara:strand:+ start:61 stop:591 length:531 start_codon:yes stop_codon:yes gene_type:complete
MDGYYTHQEYLSKELSLLKPDAIVLELGVGDGGSKDAKGSSLLMYQFAKENPKATVYAFESDQSWLNQMKEKYSLDNYIFTSIPDWDTIGDALIKHDRFNLVFVDQSPWEARSNSIDALKSNVDVFVVHDYDYFNRGYSSRYVSDENSWWGQTYSKDFEIEDYYSLLPPTLIMRKR